VWRDLPVLEEFVSEVAHIGRKAIKLANSVVNTAVLVAVLLLLVIGGYALWDSKQVYATADPNQYAIYKPSDDSDLSFVELQEINPDVCAWLEVYGTHIDYPIVQGNDNMRYINANAEGKYSLSGAIFLDTHCSRDFSDFSSILFGHHMEKQAMFGEIGLFKDKDYFDARRYGMLYYGGREHGLEFFAFLHADAYDSVVYKTGITEIEAQQGYLDMLFHRAKNTRDVKVTTDDRIILLSTCSSDSTNGRDILVAKICDEVFANPFAEEGASDGILVVNWLDSLAKLPTALKVAIVLLLCLLALALLITLKDRRQQRMLKKQDTEGAQL